MIQGTGSNVGKSTLVTGLARALLRRGLKVAPFKPQNMSNNAAITADGGEIGRAQALQARAAGLAPSVHMNPVLLKPESDQGSQVILQGKRFGTLRAQAFREEKPHLLAVALESFNHLSRDADIVLIEGAGSPAEINLRAGDIANMGFAEAADVPVVITGDIDRGGVIASLVGTHAVLEAQERARIRGFLINKFRGNQALFADGVTAIEQRTAWPCLGIVPWLPAAAWLPSEDALDLQRSGTTKQDALKIAVPMLARIANFDDLDPLAHEPAVDLHFIPPGEPLPADADLIILPGSKSTISDLALVRAQGWDIDLKAHLRRGGRVLGLCGGYQMLGRTIADPEGIDGLPATAEGLGLLDIETIMTKDKSTVEVEGRHCPTGVAIKGYEIHLGQTHGADCARPMVMIDGRVDGAISTDGRVQGTYIHGLFASDPFRAAYLLGFGHASAINYEARVESAIDALADHVEAHIDIARIIEIAKSRQNTSASAE